MRNPGQMSLLIRNRGGNEMYNDGREYEEFVTNIYQAILDSEKILDIKNIVLERNKRIEDKNGVRREFDIYWEYELGGIIYKSIIECKDYNSNISIEKIDALLGKISDMPFVNGIFATKCGYQSGAVTKAEKSGIQLLVVREPHIDDWTDDEGNDYIKELHMDIHVQFSNVIRRFNPHIDEVWAKDHNSNLEKLSRMFTPQDNLIVYDDDLKKHQSMAEFLRNSNGGELLKNGNYLINCETISLYLIVDGEKFKLKKYEIEYSKGGKTTIPIHFDQEEYILGIVEYLNSNKKKAIYKTGEVIDWGV